MLRKNTLVIIKTVGKTHTIRCDCGNVFQAFESRWRNYTGNGCRKCFRNKMFEGSNNPKYIDGRRLDKKPEYNSWRAMMNRCYNPNYRRYDRYGQRGVSVCKSWHEFANFFQDMGKKPTTKHSLDRIDNNGNYTPQNCRWATQKEQLLNSKRVKVIEINGIKDSISGHCKRHGKKISTIFARIHRQGMTPEEAIKK